MCSCDVSIESYPIPDKPAKVVTEDVVKFVATALKAHQDNAVVQEACFSWLDLVLQTHNGNLRFGFSSFWS
jgi:hypothetical protein